MIHRKKISLHRFILSLSSALDFVCPEIVDHQQRVAYIALQVARKLGYEEENLPDLILAATLHDIGMIRLDDRVRALRDGDLESVEWHGEAGYELLRGSELFARAARIIRHHHVKWDEVSGGGEAGREETIACQIVHLADWIERSIDRGANILEQSAGVMERIAEGSGSDFHPGCVDAFLAVAEAEAFWLDCVSKQVCSLLLQEMGETSVDATDKAIRETAGIFAHVVDAMSPWTASHTAGVASTSVALAKLMRLSPGEQADIRIAALLHDLGKLSVPAEILNKKGKLTDREWISVKGHTYHTYRILDKAGFPQHIIEWAAFHHERLDGAGYPFHLRSRDLKLGSRIMAIADAFTALTEDRPYRDGVESERAVAMVFEQVENGGLDGDVAAVLAENHAFIDAARRAEQELSAQEQEALAAVQEPEKVTQK